MKTLKQLIYFGCAMGCGLAFAATAPVTDLSTNTLDDRLERLERLMQSRNESQLGIQQQLDTLLEEVDTLRGSTEVHGHKLEQLVERQRELYQELETRFSRVMAASSAQTNTVLPGAVVGNGANIPAVAINYSGTVSENDAYDRAMNLVLKERQYDQAIPEFKAFIEKFPNSAYAPNAYYWVGQLLFNKSNYVEAKTQFEQVVNFYPDSNKRSDAILKLGLIALKNNDKATAKTSFDRVLAEYPGSTSAKLAGERLETLK